MNSLNQVILEGNVVKQPELKDCKNGSKICIVPLAVNRYYKDASGKKVDEVSYFDVSAFGNLASTCAQWCPKGRGIRVVGRLKQTSWETEEGQKKSHVTVVAEHIEFKPFKKANDGEADQGPALADNKNTSLSKKQKLAILTEAAKAAQYEEDMEF